MLKSIKERADEADIDGILGQHFATDIKPVALYALDVSRCSESQKYKGDDLTNNSRDPQDI